MNAILSMWNNQSQSLKDQGKSRTAQTLFIKVCQSSQSLKDQGKSRTKTSPITSLNSSVSQSLKDQGKSRTLSTSTMAKLWKVAIP